MSKPEDKKTLKEKLLSKLPKLPALKLPDMKWAEKRAKLKAAWGKFSAATKSLWAKSSTWTVSVCKKGWGKTAAFVKKYKADVIFTGILFGSTYAMISGMSYISDRDSKHPSVTFKEEGKDIVVYPAIKKLYVEQGREYFMADYARNYTCEGVLVRMPRWISHRKDGKMYSMKTCRDFNGAVGDAAHMGENIKKYGKYIELAQKQVPTP